MEYNDSILTSKTVFARNCDVRKIDRKTAGDFLDRHHVYGSAACRHCYGLFRRRVTGRSEIQPMENKAVCGELVAVACFSNARRWNKSGKIVTSYELVRYASLEDTRVVGGMGKLLKQAEAVENAKVEEGKDNNGLSAVKCTFDSGILFNTGKAELSSAAKSSLNDFAQNVLNKNTDVDVAIQGYTDNQGWKNSTAEQSADKNLDLSRKRAQAVEAYLKSCGVNGKQIKKTEGFGEQNPVQDNSTEAGRQQNRRVEIYMYASQEMIKSAQEGTLR